MPDIPIVVADFGLSQKGIKVAAESGARRREAVVTPDATLGRQRCRERDQSREPRDSGEARKSEHAWTSRV